MWQTPTYAGAEHISDYIVEWNEGTQNENFDNYEELPADNTMTFTIGSLNAGAIYELRIVAINAEGESSPSNSI
jgi:hypothetical protein